LTGNGRGTQKVPDHLKRVPDSKVVREQIRRRATELADGLDKSRPLVRREMELHAQRLLTGLELPQGYLGWTMVALASAFWRDQVAAVPYHRRLLLLPRCLRNEEACPAECDELGLLCRDCGACPLTELRAEARRKGYHVLIAEGSPTVMKIILGGQVDALLGVACLDVLERTLDKILLAGIPCMAVPLLTNGCRNTSADADWIRRMFDTPHRPAAVQTRTYLHLMRCAAQLFEPAELRRLVPPVRSGPGTGAAGRLAESDGRGIEALDPVACTEAIAYDFLTTGGKHSRPFITLAVYDALSGGRGTLADGARHVAGLPDAIKRIALAIEVFHKASLVHDDLEDDDSLRYGRPTLHRKYGLATAINVGDYLIGLGYRLVAGQRDELGAQVVADVLAQFAQAHTKLCEGQGAELVWRDARDKRLTPLDALKVYALKTAPAFEAALLAGVRLAGPADPYRQPAARFARHLGVAYQILNDLDDWQAAPVAQAGGTGDTPVEHPSHAQRPGGSDLLGGRPTVLWALALQGLDEEGRRELESLVSQVTRDGARQAAFSIQYSASSTDKISRAAELYQRAGAFERAAALVSRHHQQAVATAEELKLEPLRHLLHFLADAILDRRPLAISEEV
jgi:geranylgeranyl pyrophosphate synthase